MARPQAGRSLTREDVVEAAARLLDERGVGGLTLAELAKRLGVRSPSLYNHVDGIEGLTRQLRLRALVGLRDALAAAALGRSGREALAAICAAYRGFAASHPGLYSLTVRSAETEGDEDEAVGAGTVQVALSVLSGYDLQGAEAVHATRILRATLHGFAALEASGGFGLDLPIDDTFDLTVEALHQALLALSRNAARDKAPVAGADD